MLLQLLLSIAGSLLTAIILGKFKHIKRNDLKEKLDKAKIEAIANKVIKVFTMIYVPILIIALIGIPFVFYFQYYIDIGISGIPKEYARSMAILKSLIFMFPCLYYLRLFFQEEHCFYKLKINKF